MSKDTTKFDLISELAPSLEYSFSKSVIESNVEVSTGESENRDRNLCDEETHPMKPWRGAIVFMKCEDFDPEIHMRGGVE